jgi:hypothetical protein
MITPTETKLSRAHRLALAVEALPVQPARVSVKLSQPRRKQDGDKAAEFINVTDKASGARLSFAYGNKKLPKSTLIFSLPAVSTCPGAVSQGCGIAALVNGAKGFTGHCYALKAERMYPSVKVSRGRNLDATRMTGFVDHAAMAILEASTRRPVKMVRIHESGDFYSQAYFDAWADVARQFPAITFYAYTKSVRLDFSKRPSNFVLLLSDDKGIWTADHSRFDRVFRVDAPADQVDMICGQDCTVCDACVTGPARIGIAMH